MSKKKFAIIGAHPLNTIRAAANKPTITPRKVFRQPTTDELIKLVVAVVQHELHQQANEATRAGVFKLAACYDEAFPHHERYVRHVKTVEINEAHFKSGLNCWDLVNDKNKRKAVALAQEYLRATLKQLGNVGKFLQHQQDLMKDWDDSRLETLAKIQKDMGFAQPEE